LVTEPGKLRKLPSNITSCWISEDQPAKKSRQNNTNGSRPHIYISTSALSLPRMAATFSHRWLIDRGTWIDVLVFCVGISGGPCRHAVAYGDISVRLSHRESRRMRDHILHCQPRTARPTLLIDMCSDRRRGEHHQIAVHGTMCDCRVVES
jgi:hypothetical protein